jgi:glutaredoxin 3
MSDAKVQVYVTDYCGYCRSAKRLLKERGVPFDEVNLSDQPALRDQLVARYHWTTVPIIVADGDLIGGYTDLVALDRARGLDHLKPQP